MKERRRCKLRSRSLLLTCRSLLLNQGLFYLLVGLLQAAHAELKALRAKIGESASAQGSGGPGGGGWAGQHEGGGGRDTHTHRHTHGRGRQVRAWIWSPRLICDYRLSFTVYTYHAYQMICHALTHRYTHASRSLSRSLSLSLSLLCECVLSVCISAGPYVLSNNLALHVYAHLHMC